jgi:hypothetical protein
MSKLRSLDELFAGRHFGREVIILFGRRYLRYKVVVQARETGGKPLASLAP